MSTSPAIIWAPQAAVSPLIHSVATTEMLWHPRLAVEADSPMLLTKETITAKLSTLREDAISIGTLTERKVDSPKSP